MPDNYTDRAPKPDPPQQPPHTAGAKTAEKFQPTFDESYAYFKNRLKVSLPARDKVPAHCPFHDDRNPSMTINLKEGTWYCHACGVGGGMLDFERKMMGTDTETAWSEIYRITGMERPKQNRRLVATYDYTDVDGTLLYQKLRYEPKQFSQRQPDGKGGWRYNLDGVKRVLYNLPRVVTAKYVCIVEGEKDADNLHALLNTAGVKDFSVTTTFDGAGHWKPEYSPYFTGRMVVVLHDDDDKGKQHQQTICASVKPFAAKVKAIDLPGLSETVKDISGWLAAGHTVLELLELIKLTPVWTSPPDQAASEKLDGWPAPEPLGDELPQVPAFPPELLPEKLRPWCIDIATRLQVPIDFVACAVIAALGAACMRRAMVQPKRLDTGWLVVPIIWGLLIGEPGTKKTPTISIVFQPLHKIEAAWLAEFKGKDAKAKIGAEQHELELQAYREQYKKFCKDKKVEPSRPKPANTDPQRKRLIANDVTYEALSEMLADNPAGVSIVRDEIAGLLQSFERQGREGDRAFFLECWGGHAPFSSARIGRGETDVAHCAVGVFGGGQPNRIHSYMREVQQDDGLFQRLQLMVWPDYPRNAGYVDAIPDENAQRTATEVFERIAAMDGEKPRIFKFAPDAQRLFEEWLPQLDSHVLNDDLPAAVRAHLAKYRSLMPAIALLLALADGGEEISLRHAKMAAAWCEYLEPHAMRVYSVQVAPERIAAQLLARKLANGSIGAEGRFTLRDVYRPQWTGLPGPDEARAALRVLSEYNWVRKSDPVQDGTGRPSETYLINPAIRGEK